MTSLYPMTPSSGDGSNGRGAAAQGRRRDRLVRRDDPPWGAPVLDAIDVGVMLIVPARDYPGTAAASSPRHAVADDDAQSHERSDDERLADDAAFLIQTVNRGFVELTGFAASEACGQPWSRFFRDFPERDLLASVRGALRLKSSCKTTIQVQRADGTLVGADLSVRPMLDEHGKLVHFAASLVDVSPHIRNETELAMDRARAEAANRAKSEFLAMMSHEIRTPMTTILGVVDVLLSGEAEPENVDMLKMIRGSGQHLTSLIEDILDLSKIEAGKLKIDNEACHPAEIVRDVVSLMSLEANEKSIELRVQYDQSIPCQIESDPGRLRQILFNLIGNAVKYTDAGHVDVGIQFDGQWLTFLVRDTGPGMTPEEIARLFEPFSRLESGRRQSGNGLGLCISRRLARLLGGTLEVDSVPGRGSTFYLALDVRDCASSSLLAPREAAGKELGPKTPQPLNCRILVAEDTRGIQFIIRRILESAGAQVRVVDNGAEAVHVLLEAEEAEAFDLVLMDMQMPVMDGFDAVETLRAGGCELPIIALTASAMRGDREKCLAIGCDDYVPKPVVRQELLTIVAKHLSVLSK